MFTYGLRVKLILFFITIAWIVFLVHFLWRIGKIYFTRENLSYPAEKNLSDLPFVSVIVPARNEETNIDKCVRSLADQLYPEEKYEIIVVDDNSTDNTSRIAKKIAADHQQIMVISAGPLPQGWAGKNHACMQGTKKAEGEWYCFMDADTTADPNLLANALHFSEKKRIDMLSINPFQELLSCTERLFMPGIFLSIAAGMNFNRVNDPSRPDSGANGQFMLFRKSAYDAIGGHAAVKQEIMEDMALADRVKKSGFRLYWIFGEKLVRTRMYHTFSHIWEGLSKNMTDIMKDSGKIAPLKRALSSLVLGWAPLLLPLWAWADLNSGGTAVVSLWTFSAALTASFSFLIFYTLTLRALNTPLRYVPAFPLGFTLHAALTLNSMRKIIQGKRQWKGRVYS